MDFPLNIPAYLSDFSSAEDRRTTAKLKVFYVGETGDGRIFDEDFAQLLVKSLPCTPVVAFYSDLKDDFIGHNHTQYIYGFVKPDAESGFETDENGVKWFITEVLLYTDRVDNIGEIAKKIVGHAQSLEMDPNTVTYEIFRENGKRKIRFTNARFAGLSVLGTDQKPAFTGSEFFVDNADLRERFETFFSCLEQKDRGVSMNKEQFSQLLDFIKLSYDEKRQLVCQYAQTQLGDNCYAFIPEIFDDSCVVGSYDFYTGEESYQKYNYTIDEANGVQFSNGEKCFRRFVTISELKAQEEVPSTDATIEQATEATSTVESSDSAEPVENATEEPVASTESEATNDVTDAECKKPKQCEDGDNAEKKEPEEEDEEEDEEDAKKKQCADADAPTTSDEVENHTLTNDEGEAHVEAVQETTQEENFTSNPSTLSDSEREELENFRLEKKLNLINSYKDELDADMIQSFTDTVKDFSYDELEAKLAIEFRKFSKTNKKNNTEVPFSFAAMTNKVEHELSYADLVKSVLNK